MNSTIKVFIGSGDESLLERKVLIYSIREHTQREVEIAVFNGTHNTIERDDGQVTAAPLATKLKKRNLTEFSLYRYLIPESCGFSGRAIYLDSDMLCLTDIGELFDSPLRGNDFLCTRAYTDAHGEPMHAMSTLLIDCERCPFDLSQVFDEIDRGLYSYTQFSQMGKEFLRVHPYQIGELDERWNVFDRYDSQTKIIHYTNLETQPWKFAGHPFGDIWFKYLSKARDAGFVTEKDIEDAQQGSKQLVRVKGRVESFAARVRSAVRRISV